MGSIARPPLGYSWGWPWLWPDHRHQPSPSPILLAQATSCRDAGVPVVPQKPSLFQAQPGEPPHRLSCLATVGRPQAWAPQGELHPGSESPLRAGALALTDRNSQESPTALSPASTHQAQEVDVGLLAAQCVQPWCPGKLGWGGGTETRAPRKLPGLTPGNRGSLLATQARTLQRGATRNPAT